MKIGKTLQELAVEVERQRIAKRDFLVDSRNLILGTDAKWLTIVPDAGSAHEAFGLTEHAHGQIAEYCGIPKPYYDRMRKEQPDLAAANVNRWLEAKPEPRMVRTLDNNCRAFMSRTFRPLDNFDLMAAALPALSELQVDVVSCELTASRLYLKVIDQRISRDLPNGATLGQGHHRFDTVCPAMVISNSEIGMGALSILTSVWTGGCTNLAVISERSTRKRHTGAKLELGEEVYQLLSDETRRKTDEALWAQVGDVVRGAFDEAQFDALCTKIAATAENLIPDPMKTVELTAKRFGMTETEGSSILRHLIAGGSLTQYGLHAAVTRASQDFEDYDRASEFEQLGGKIIELPKNEWRELAEAA